MHKPYLFGIHANPPKVLRWVYSSLGFLAVILIYYLWSNNVFYEVTNAKLDPSFYRMGERFIELATQGSEKTGLPFLWSDTSASLYRFSVGLTLSALVGLFMGVNMALFPGMRDICLPFITAISNIPMIALMPILLLMFGIEDLAKIMLIFLGTVFFIARDMYTTTREVPKELLVKARTLGTSQFSLVYRIVLPMVMPRLIEAVRVNLGPAWLFLIASEGIAADVGLGYRIFLVRRYQDMAATIPYVIWVGLIAFCLDRLMVFVCEKVYPWKKE